MIRRSETGRQVYGIVRLVDERGPVPRFIGGDERAIPESGLKRFKGTGESARHGRQSQYVLAKDIEQAREHFVKTFEAELLSIVELAD